jgi:alpha-1,3-mannosyltransferase
MLKSASAPQAADRPLVVHVVRQFWPNRGGLEDVVLNLCRQGLAAGYRIRVVTLNSLFSDPDLKLADHETHEGVEIVRIPWRGSSRYPVAPSVLKHIGDADLVHVHAIDFFFDFLALTRLAHGKRMIVTTHGGFFHTRKFAAIKSIWFNTLTRFSASQYRFVIGCSGSDVETFAAITKRNLAKIENGADTGKFHDRAALAAHKRIITIGRFSSNKRIDRLIEVAARLVKKDPSWRLDIVGVDSDLTGREITAMAAKAGVAEAVTVHVGLPNDDVADLVSQASLYASASDYEGFGLVAIEAMSAGLKPVLEANAAFQSLADRHDVIRLTDFSVPERAAAALEESWQALSRDPGAFRARAISQAGDYSWDRVAGLYFDLYRQAAA